MFVNRRLSDNFTLAEFRCKGMSKCCGGAASIDTAHLVPALQRIRDLFGGPVNCVTSPRVSAGSGFRCLVHNRSVGGARGSLHTLGRAADIWVPGDYGALLSACRRVAHDRSRIRLIEYPAKKFVHVEVRY